MKSKHHSTETSQDVKVIERNYTVIELIGHYDFLKLTEYHSCTETINIIDADGKVIEQISKIENKQIVSIRQFELKTITRQQLLEFRKKRIPSFVLKDNENFFYTTIDPEISFLSPDILGHHMCSLAPDCCDRLSPASDEDGGCAKVRNMARFIELYPWISLGYETFNTRCDAFLVAKCDHYKRFVKTPKAVVSKQNTRKKKTSNIIETTA